MFEMKKQKTNDNHIFFISSCFFLDYMNIVRIHYMIV